MAEREVQSPVSVKGSKVGSSAPLSPARAVILHVDAPDSRSVRPSYGTSRRHSEEPES